MEINLENKNIAITLLNQGICPICNKSYIEVLKHIVRSHKITAKEIKDILLLPYSFTFISNEQSEKYRQNAIKHDFKSKLISDRKGKKLNIITKEKMKEKAILRLKENPNYLQVFKEGAQKARNKAIEKSNEVCKKAVIRISPDRDIKIYESMTDAARDGNTYVSNISRCIKNNKLDCRGNKWVLYNEYKKVPNNT